MTDFETAMAKMPIIAILRGVKPDEVVPIGEALYARGIRCIEVPMNSPEPFVSIRSLTEALPDDCITGGGTMLTAEQVAQLVDVGGRIVVSPNMDEDVIKASVAAGLISAPGIGSASEAFAALKAGASALKLFPASTYGPDHVKAMRAVLPPEVPIVATGGVGAKNMAEWQAAGTQAFGIGSEIYKAGDSVETVAAKADALCTAIGL